MRSRLRLHVAVVLLSLGRAAFAQDARVTVRGVAYDSLRAAPLGSAMITLSGQAGPRSTTADPRGRFEFDSVAPGRYTLSMLHDVLDTIGLSGIQSRITVTDGRAEVRIAVPSFATIWKAACGDRRAPRDSGIVFGVVRSAMDRSPVPEAFVQLMWLDVQARGVRGVRGVHLRRYRQLTRSVSTGAYGLCGVPSDAGVRLQAATDSAASGAIDVPFSDLRVRRMDVVIGPSTADSLNRGSVAGFISDTGGKPYPNARIRVDGAREAVTGDDGRFRVSAVPLGTRQVDVVAIGVAPEQMTVDVMAGDTAFVLAQLKRVTLLDVIRVTASRQYRAFVADLEDRKKSGLGYVRDSSEIGGWGTIQGVFSQFPSTEVRPMGRGAISDYLILLPGRLDAKCVATLWLDGRRAQYEELSMLRPDDFAAVEVYPRYMTVPAQFQRATDDCGAAVIWTKRGLPR